MKRVTEGAGPQWGEHGYVEYDNGQQYRIESDEPTRSPMSNNKASKPVLWTSTRTLTLSNGDEVYGCVDCDYVAVNHLSVRPHRNTHRKNKLTRSATTDGDVNPLDRLREVLKKAEKAGDVAADRDRWKKRALDAERELSGLRQMAERVLGS